MAGQRAKNKVSVGAYVDLGIDAGIRQWLDKFPRKTKTDFLTKEGFNKSELESYHTQRQAMSRFCLGAMLLSDPIVELVRRQLRHLSPGVKLDLEEIRQAIANEVLKREVQEGDKAEEARRKIARALNRSPRSRAKAEPSATVEPPAPAPVTAPAPPQTTQVNG